MTSAGQTNVSAFELTRLGLARIGLEAAKDLTRGFQRAMAASAATLEVARAGIWFWSRDGHKLHSATTFDSRSQQYESGEVLDMRQYPTYARSLLERRVIVASDARSAVETCELRDTYLDPRGITSMLDAPLYRGGEVVGVVCLEHVGPARRWLDRERDFAASVADIIAVMLEQSTRLEAEAALAKQRERTTKTERVDALARLGAGLAHDFNNILSSILLRAETLRARYADDPTLQSELSALIADGKFGARLIRQLFLFAKREKTTPIHMDLVKTVEESLPVLKSLARSAEVTLDLAVKSPVAIYADRTHVEQVLMNLVTNARDAEARHITIRLEADTEDAILRVVDDGTGMDADTQSNVFEPFYTTKGHGSGIGLSTVQSIVQQCGGHVSATSVLGEGSTFSVRLPRSA